MNRPSLLAPVLLASTCLATSVFAGEATVPLERYEREERHVYREYVPEYRPQPRTVYVIIEQRPVPCVVYPAVTGGYYRIHGGRRMIVREPVYASLQHWHHSRGHHGRMGTRIRY
jgi:hypothetical protein